MSAESAVEFAKMQGEISRLANGKAEQASALLRIAQEIAATRSQNQLAHEEIKAIISDNTVNQERRLSTIEGEVKTLSERVNFLRSKLWGLLALAASAIVSLVIAHLAGVY